VTESEAIPIHESGTCALCGNPYTHWGNNPQPVLPDYEQRVCDDCNSGVVMRARLSNISNGRGAYDATGPVEDHDPDSIGFNRPPGMVARGALEDGAQRHQAIKDL